MLNKTLKILYQFLYGDKYYNDRYLFSEFHCEVRDIFEKNKWKKNKNPDNLSSKRLLKMPRQIHSTLDAL